MSVRNDFTNDDTDDTKNNNTRIIYIVYIYIHLYNLPSETHTPYDDTEHQTQPVSFSDLVPSHVP